DLGDHPAGRGVQSGELDVGDLADQTASSVVADEVLPAQQRVLGQLDVDAAVVLHEARHLPAPKHGNLELVDPAPEDPLELAPPQRKAVVVSGGEVADVQGD